jgi:hypothetical protein
MHKTVSIAALATILCFATPSSFAKTPPAAKSTSSIVIVFKDGHRQSINMSDVDRIEFPGSAVASAPAGDSGANNAFLPSRGRFVGKWEAGDGNGGTFYINLDETGDAHRSIGGVHGKWTYVDGEARITWDDGAQDAIRKVGSRYQKFAYEAGKSFTDVPANVTSARLTNPRPI